WVPHNGPLKMEGSRCSLPYQSPGLPLLSTLYEPLSKQLISVLGVAISTYETRPPRHPLRGRLDKPPPQRREDVRQFAHEQHVAGHHGRATEDLEATGNSPSAPGAVHQRSQCAGLALAMCMAMARLRRLASSSAGPPPADVGA